MVLVHVLHVAAPLDQGQLLQILIIRVRRHAHVSSLASFVVAHLQVRQLLLGLPKFVIVAFLSRVDG